MTSFLSTLALGLIAALVGTALQQRNWRHKHKVELRQRDRTEAMDTILRISSALDKRLYEQRLFTQKVSDGIWKADDHERYRTALADWMASFSSNKSMIQHSFGPKKSLDFENIVQRKIYAASENILLKVRFGEELSTRDKKKFSRASIELDLAQREIGIFLNELNEMVDAGEIGTSREINNINAQNLFLVSRIYLIRRLLSMDSSKRNAY